MTRENVQNAILAAVLGALIAVSSVGCLISGFDLKVEQTALIVMLGGLFAGIGAVCFSHRYGSLIALGVLGMSMLFFWQGGNLETQTLALITRISYTYDQAYQCGVLRFGGAWYGVATDLPMLLLVCLIALAVTWVICRRRPTVFALLAAFLPLAVCLVVTDTVPNAWCLFILLTGIVALLLSASARRRDPERSPAQTLTSAVAALTALAVLFLAVPQEEYVNPLEVYQNQILAMLGIHGNGTGGSGSEEIDGVDLKNLGTRFILPYKVMTVTADTDGVIYLRERDFNRYDGRAWTSDDDRTDVLTTYAQGAQGQLSITTEWYRAQMLVPYYSRARFTGGRSWNVTQTLTYEWAMQTLPDNWKELIPNETLPATDSDAVQTKYYHSLPTDTQGWAQTLLAEILTDERSATAIADTVAAYVKNSATYENFCERMPSSETDFAKWFVEAGETGYCVHFATSTAVLLRAAGVQTRYVTGYMVDTVANEPVTVTADLEHAWVEYYEPALDMWIVLESTPAVPVQTEDEEDTDAETTTTAPTDGEQTTTTAPTVPTRPGEDDPASSEQAKAIAAMLGKLALIVLGVAAVVAAVIGQRRWRLKRRQKRWEQGSQNERALMLWWDAVRMNRRIGGESPQALYELAQKAKYSQHTLTDEELEALRRERDSLEKLLRTRPWYAQFVYRYIVLLY